LIDGTILFGTSSIKPKGYVIQRLNWSGCEFLDACRDEGRWMKAKVVIDEMKGASFDIIKAVLIDLMKRQVSTILTSGTI